MYICIYVIEYNIYKYMFWFYFTCITVCNYIIYVMYFIYL